MTEDREKLLKLYGDTRAFLLSVIDGLPETAMVEPLIDGWSVKDHLVHITAWDELRALEVERISRGLQTAWRTNEAQGDAYSAMVRTLRSGHSLAQVLEELAWSRERLLAALRSASEEGLDGSRYGEAGLVSHHELAHAGWIRNWRQRAGLQRRSRIKTMTGKSLDWQQWHREYDDPTSRLSRRLAVVQQRLREALDRHAGPVRLVSMCAGEGRDVIPVLAERQGGASVDALLVELDPRNATAAAVSARAAGLRGTRVREADAARLESYAGAVPADIVLACGVFGNISRADIRFTVMHLPMLCAPAATVIWTRGRWKDNDPTPDIRRWFSEAGFEELSFDAPHDSYYSVGAARLAAPPAPFDSSITLFRFFR